MELLVLRQNYSIKYHRCTIVTNVTTLGLAMKIGGSIVGTSRAYFDERSGKNEYSHCISTIIVDSIYAKV